MSCLPETIEKDIVRAEIHHIESNAHHPESHTDINQMSDVDIIEMVCDWTAIARAQGEPSARAWVKSCIPKKYPFDERRSALIFRLLDVLSSTEE